MGANLEDERYQQIVSILEDELAIHICSSHRFEQCVGCIWPISCFISIQPSTF